ncbi:MAG: V-type ATP synthase subunit E [Treponema sp.]|jgi:V/A-type H+-transporting ATPase subunit E|nr:V-type ATP synthase subunit E [Treponema sp.]
MEIQVKELIDKIRKDGVDNAAEEAAKIKAEAEAQAARILETAKKEADGIISNSKESAQLAEKAGIAALQQACRNLVLAFRGEIQVLLDKIVNDSINANYNEDVLKSALPEILKNWASKNSDDLSVILPENELAKLKDFFNSKLKGELNKGVELKSNRKLNYGFHISNKEGSAYYDFSSEAVCALLSAYLNPKLAEILNDAVKGM